MQGLLAFRETIVGPSHAITRRPFVVKRHNVEADLLKSRRTNRRDQVRYEAGEAPKANSA
jgi:hypothetical protein